MEKLQQWQRVKEIVGSALERPAAERRAYLDQVCSDHSELRADVESLLSAYPDSGTFFESFWPHPSAKAESQTHVIGPYRLLKELGVGGMGQVWLAEQSDPIRRQVALKLIRAGMYDSATVQRFKAERQSLAIMDHPTIAKIFDAGTTPAGQPYLVMEYVDGQPITDYCDSRKLTIRERLQLFMQVCEGVQHAHQKAIIHRDLKPSNVLVVEVDGKPTPRIIDFGLAKAAAPLIPGETLFTLAGTFLGTPGYMSPEQADPRARDVDTRSDVYSLGVILYELLTGLLPFETAEWKNRPREDVLRELRESDPVRPSAKVAAAGEAATQSASARGSDRKQLIRLLRGDLDWVTLKGIERDRDRRYPTTLALATDIENYLESRPVTAHAASIGYRARKYGRRHAASVSVAAAALALLAAFAVMQGVQLRRTTRERDRADRITEFMKKMFQVSDPSEARGNTVTVREILDKSAREIDTSLAKDPEQRAEMLDVMGTVYFSLGLYSRAQPLLEQAVETRRRILGAEDPNTLQSTQELADTLEGEAQYSRAEQLYRATLEARRRILGREHPDTLRSTVRLAAILSDQGHMVEAGELFQQAFNIQTRVMGPEHPDTLRSADNLSFIMEQDGRYGDAEKLQRHILEVKRRVLGQDHPQTLRTMDYLADTLDSEGRYSEAEQLERELIDIRLRVLGREHEDTLISMMNWGLMLGHMGRNVEAEHALRQVLDVQRRVLGPEHRETLASMSMLASTLMHMGRYADAEKLELSALELRRRVYGADHPDTAVSRYTLACIEAQSGQPDKALALLRQAVDHGLDRPTALGLESDADLKSLRGNPGFGALIQYTKQRFASAAKGSN